MRPVLLAPSSADGVVIVTLLQLVQSQRSFPCSQTGALSNDGISFGEGMPALVGITRDLVGMPLCKGGISSVDTVRTASIDVLEGMATFI